MFEEKLFELKKTIDALCNKSEEELQKEVIDRVLNEKLERSYNNYAQMIAIKINYILSRNNYKVIKALNRMKKEQEEAAKKKDNDEDSEEFEDE